MFNIGYNLVFSFRSLLLVSLFASVTALNSDHAILKAVSENRVVNWSLLVVGTAAKYAEKKSDYRQVNCKLW